MYMHGDLGARENEKKDKLFSLPLEISV